MLNQCCMQRGSYKLVQRQLGLRNKLHPFCTVHPVDQGQVITRQTDRETQTNTPVRAEGFVVWCRLEKVLGIAFSLKPEAISSVQCVLATWRERWDSLAPGNTRLPPCLVSQLRACKPWHQQMTLHPRLGFEPGSQVPMLLPATHPTAHVQAF